jgi:hypothetical protein
VALVLQQALGLALALVRELQELTQVLAEVKKRLADGQVGALRGDLQRLSHDR